MFIAALLVIAKTGYTWMPINKWLDKQSVVQEYNGPQSNKKNELLIRAVTWMILKRIMLSSGSKTKKYILYDSINIKCQEMQTNINDRKQIGDCQEMRWEVELGGKEGLLKDIGHFGG